MLKTPAIVRKKALSLYKKYLSAWLLDDAFFPVSIPAGSANIKAFDTYTKAVNALKADSIQGRGYGYTIETITRRTRQYGEQSIPQQLIFHTPDDLLRYLRKSREFVQFQKDVACVRAAISDLETWLYDNPMKVVNHAGSWDDLMRVCLYFMHHPLPDRYTRELPVDVHTKFIERHKGILRRLLDVCLPPDAYHADEANFEQRYGLKTPPAWFHMRLLDPTLQKATGLPFTDFALPVSQITGLQIPARQIIIVENKMTFLTLPHLPGTIGIWGHGFAVHALNEVGWLQHIPVFYWGDIDAQGFEILSGLRKNLPHVQSIMMNQQTLDTFAGYITAGTASNITELAHLTLAERAIFQSVQSTQQRLEQEHIYHAWACQTLAQIIV